MRVDLLRYAAFTQDTEPTQAGGPKEGNPAGVVLDASTLDGDAMQRLAAGLSDVTTTGFLCPETEGSLRLRFFTPRAEIPMCGHVVVAVTSALARAKRGTKDAEGARTFTFATGAGPVVARIDAQGGVRQRHPLPRFRDADVSQAAVALALGLEPLDLAQELPLGIAGTGLDHLLVPVLAPDVLARIEPRRDALEALERALEVHTVGVFAPRDLSRGEVRVRDFTCGLGPREEPASGTTNAALAAHLWRAGVLPGDAPGSHVLRSTQGVELGRPSRVVVRLVARNGNITSVEVSGRARPDGPPRVLEVVGTETRTEV